MSEHITITRSEAYDLLNDLMELERCMSFMAHQVSAYKALALGYARQAERVKARRLALLEKLEGGELIMDRKYIAVLPGGTTARIVSGSFTLNISTDDADPTIEIEMLQNNGEFPPELDADYIIVVRQKDGE